uniref:hypothetical protein n=1 Tax=Gracilaria caudata TaxID=2572395 RepID=UPI001D102476|nr:hypothetical protein LK014_pgp003 [Gracilaria caudata]UAD83657.1 hypothetical protein [Gracilaria caudata]
MLFNRNVNQIPSNDNVGNIILPSIGDIPSKIANTASTPNEGCRQFTSTKYHKDGSKTVNKTLSCNSSEKFDKNGVSVKKTDTNQAKFQSAKKDFFGSSSGSSSKPTGN